MTAKEPEGLVGTAGKEPAPGPEKVNTPTGRRALDRLVILREAVRFIDAHGRDRLTMRRLGAELGVEAMALYRYVPGRDQLLDGVVEVVMDELYAQTMTGTRPGTWQEFLQQMAHGVRAMSMEHPKIFPLVASRPPAAPWLRPPLRSLDWVEMFLGGLAQEGFDDDTSVGAYRAFTSFLLGHLLLEASLLGAQTAPAEEPLDEGDSDVPNADQQLDLRNYPNITRLEAQLSEDHAGPEFERALEDLLDRLDREHTE
jgi:AcrR family transcriptional regulator